MSVYRCPKCHSPAVRALYPEVVCLNCGFSEGLVDFPISWNEHRRNCLEFGQHDPGPYKPLEHDQDELEQRISELEKASALSKPKDKRRPKAEGVVL